MKCPNDQTTLVMSDRSGIEIDYCPDCRGVWLDRGELDKIIDRAGPAPASAASAAPPHPEPRYDSRPPQQQYGDQCYSQPYDRRRKKENWLSELFD